LVFLHNCLKLWLWLEHGRWLDHGHGLAQGHPMVHARWQEQGLVSAHGRRLDHGHGLAQGHPMVHARWQEQGRASPHGRRLDYGCRCSGQHIVIAIAQLLTVGEQVLGVDLEPVEDYKDGGRVHVVHAAVVEKGVPAIFGGGAHVAGRASGVVAHQDPRHEHGPGVTGPRVTVGVFGVPGKVTAWGGKERRGGDEDRRGTDRRS